MTQLILLQTLSSLHPGTGQGVGAIDLPIAREKATGIPYMPGSTIKGVLRDACEVIYPPSVLPGGQKQDHPVIVAVFGAADADKESSIGAVQFTDAKLLLMPVRSLAGVFGWVTSPYLIRQFVRDSRLSNPNLKAPSALPEPARDCAFVASKTLDVGGKILLEDTELTQCENTVGTEWIEKLKEWIKPESYLAERLCIVHDDVMQYFLETATEVRERVRLENETKVVAEGALWYEENLPTETLLYGLVRCDKPRREFTYKGQTYSFKDQGSKEAVVEIVKDLTHRKTHQFGGKATVGRGLCEVWQQGVVP